MIASVTNGVTVTLTLTAEDAGIITSALWKAYNVTQDDEGACECDYCKSHHRVATEMYDLMGRVYDAQYDEARGL